MCIGIEEVKKNVMLIITFMFRFYRELILHLPTLSHCMLVLKSEQSCVLRAFSNPPKERVVRRNALDDRNPWG